MGNVIKKKPIEDAMAKAVVGAETIKKAFDDFKPLSGTENAMTQMERDELAARIKGMSQEELKIVLDCIPVEMCLTRVAKEIDKLQAFKNSINNAMTAAE